MGSLTFLLGSLTLFSFVAARGGNLTWRNWDFVINSLAVVDMHPDFFGPETKVTVDGPHTFSYTKHILQRLPSDLKSVYNSYEKNTRNEYVPSLVVKGTLCEDYEKEVYGMPFFKCTHYVDAGIKECPFKKGLYSVTNAKCTSSDGPIMVPGHYWLLNNTWITSNNVVLLRRIFEFTIIRRTSVG